MKTINKSVLIWYSPREMYDLVTAVAEYPQFLPWCDHASVLSETADGMTAEVGIAMAGQRQQGGQVAVGHPGGDRELPRIFTVGAMARVYQ